MPHPAEEHAAQEEQATDGGGWPAGGQDWPVGQQDWPASGQEWPARGQQDWPAGGQDWPTAPETGAQTQQFSGWQSAGPVSFRPDSGQPSRRPPATGGGRSRSSLTVGLIVLGLVVLAGGGVLAWTLLKHHGSPHHASAAHPSEPTSTAPSSSVPSTPPSTPPTSASASPPSEQQAATSLATLLGNSVTDRSSVNAAYNDALQCGPNLGQDAQTFSSAATSRQQLLSQLASMPGRSALPSQLLGDLTTAWQASIKADQDFAAWAQDQASGTCTPNGQSDRHFQAANGPDLQATAAKKAFANLWNPLASTYGLTTYQQSDL
jgi:hypothetical protein